MTAGSTRRRPGCPRPGYLRWGFAVQPVSGGTVGATVAAATTAGRSPSFTWDGKNQAGAVVTDGPYRITLWTADASNNRADRTVHGDRRPDARGSHARPRRVATSRPTATATRHAAALVDVECRAVTGVVRIRNSDGHVGPGPGRSRGKTSWKKSWTGRTAAGDVRARRPLHVPGGGSRPGRQPDRRPADDPRRRNDRGRSGGPTAPSTRARARRARR